MCKLCVIYITMEFSNPLQIQSCSITLTEFNDKEDIIYLPCNHVFSPIAIFSWIEQSESCPMCRKHFTKNDLIPGVFKLESSSAPPLDVEQASKYVICSTCKK